MLNPAFPKRGWPWNPFNLQLLLTLGEGFHGTYFRNIRLCSFTHSFTNARSLDLPKFKNSSIPPQSVHLSEGDTCEVVYKKVNEVRARSETQHASAKFGSEAAPGIISQTNKQTNKQKKKPWQTCWEIFSSLCWGFLLSLWCYIHHLATATLTR